MVERKQFYKEDVDQVLSYQAGNLSASEVPRRVALMYDINTLECDKAKIKVTIHSRLRAAKSMDNIVSSFSTSRLMLVLLPLTLGMMRGVISVDARAPMVQRPAAKRGLMPATC